jgi:hypothetical protein
MSDLFKSVRICFPASGAQRDVLMPVDDQTTLNSLVTLLQKFDAVAVEAENLSSEEIEFLRSATDNEGRSLFVANGHCDDCSPRTADCKGILLKIQND